MTPNTVTAVIPVYNKEKYVARAIRSVLDQTRPVDEIIIVDDGSSDGSRDEIEQFRDSRIRLLRPAASPGGPSRARNHAIRHATSTWVAFLDADDTWHSHFIAEFEASLDRSPDEVSCVFTGWHNVWADGSITKDRYSAEFNERASYQVDFDTFVADWVSFRSCPMWTSAVVMKREVLLRAGLFPERCQQGEDKDTWLRVMALTNGMRSCRPSSSYYRSTGTQITRTCSLNIRHCLCPTLERMISETSGRRRRLLKRLFNTEVYEYAVHVGQKERISPEMYRGFYTWLDPGRYCVLLALTYVPVRIQGLVRSFVLAIGSGLGRPSSRWQATAVELSRAKGRNPSLKDQSASLLDQ
jgi:cellulose synthase/poly-beta-1,6-N-acetylglucosamine synthase-like glycosyltransferase